jgi:hypothetical protein
MPASIIIPGKRAGNIKKLVNKTCGNPDVLCRQETNTKLIDNSNSYLIPNSSKASRIMSLTNYPRTGTTLFGNNYQPKHLQQSAIINYLNN